MNLERYSRLQLVAMLTEAKRQYNRELADKIEHEIARRDYQWATGRTR